MKNLSVHFQIDAAERGAPLGNKVSDINIWSAANIDETVRPSPLGCLKASLRKKN